MKIGVIGSGFGAAHVELLQGLDGVQVEGIASRQLERARETARRFGVPFATDDYRALIAHVEAIVIASPPALHAEMALAAIATGRHVLCEKPLASSTSAARAMRDAARAAGIVHMVNFQGRYSPQYRAMRRLIDDGYVGRLVMTDARVTINPVGYLHLPLWSTSKAGWFTDPGQGGGLLASSAGPHLADLMLWLGGQIVEVAARSVVAQPSVPLSDGTTADVSAEDGFLVLTRFAGGAIGTIRGVPVAHRGQGIGWALDLHGDAGSLELDGDALRGARVGEPAPAPIDVPLDGLDARVQLVTRFVDAIGGGGASPTPTFDDGLAAQTVLDACLRAVRSGSWEAVEAV